jgi:hypothetical protein
LALAGVVDEEFGNLAERPPLFAVVDDDPDAALLCGLDANLDPVDEIGAASADVRAEHVRPVALVMDTTGDHGAGLRDPFDGTEEIDRHAADRGQQDLEIGPSHEFGKHPPGLLEQGAPQIGLGDPEAGGQPGQMPHRIDRRLGDADLAIVEQNLAVWPQGAVGEKRAELRGRNSRPSDRDGRTYVDAGADVFRKDLADKMAPGVERYDFRRIAPLGMRPDQGRRRGIGEVGPMVTRQSPGRHRKRAIDCVSPGVRADGIAVSRLCGARHDGPAFGRAGRAPTQRNGASTSGSWVGSQTNVTRCGMIHDLFARERSEMESVMG